MSAENPDLPLLRLQLRFEALERIDDLPEFRGAFWRGLFGRALKRFSESHEPFEALWPQSVATVATGGIARAALYDVLFSPDDAGGPVPPHRRPPAPFVVDAPHGPAWLRPGEIEMIGLTLIGERAAAALPVVLAAFGRAAEDGLGRTDAAGRRGRARLADAMLVWREEGAACSILSTWRRISSIHTATL